MALVGLGLGIGLLGGCETTERTLSAGERHVTAVDPSERVTNEERLVARCEENPYDAKAWYELGEYYEVTRLWPEAINAFSQLKGLCDEEAKKYTPPRPFTAGEYHLGRVYAKARMFPEALHHLRAVLQLQPEDPSLASLNPHFREAHYLLGAIYFENKQWAPAKEQFVTFEQLGGEPERVEPWLVEIEEATWTGHVRTRRTDTPQEPSQPPAQPRTPPAQGAPAQTPPAPTPPAPTPPAPTPPDPTPPPATGQ